MQYYTPCIALYLSLSALALDPTPPFFTDPTMTFDLCPNGNLTDLEYTIEVDSWLRVQTQNYPKPEITNMNECYKNIKLHNIHEGQFWWSYENKDDTVQNTAWVLTIPITVSKAGSHFTYIFNYTRKANHYLNLPGHKFKGGWHKVYSWPVYRAEAHISDAGNGQAVAGSRGMRFNMYFTNISTPTQSTNADTTKNTNDAAIVPTVGKKTGEGSVLVIIIIGAVVALLVVVGIVVKVVTIKRKLAKLKQSSASANPASDVISKTSDDQTVTEPITASFFAGTTQADGVQSVNPTADGLQSVNPTADGLQSVNPTADGLQSVNPTADGLQSVNPTADGLQSVNPTADGLQSMNTAVQDAGTGTSQ